MNMPRPRPLHVHRETSRHGKHMWYYRPPGGPRTRLFAKFGTPEFLAEYRAAVAGHLYNPPEREAAAKVAQRPPRKGWVYFAVSGNRVKIGTAANVAVRLSELQVGSPDPIHIARRMRGDRTMEREFHERFRKYHVRGEWFRYRGELAAFIDGEDGSPLAEGEVVLW